MSLWKIEAVRADLLPDKGYRIQAKGGDTGIQIEPNNFDKFEQNLWIAEVKINLIVAKSTPDMSFTVDGGDFIQ
jgi:hypothetical protein